MLRPLLFSWFSYQEVHPVTLGVSETYTGNGWEAPFWSLAGFRALLIGFPSMPEDLDSILSTEAERVLDKSVKS